MTSESDCTQCREGYSCLEGSRTETICAAGNYSLAGSATCSRCGEGGEGPSFSAAPGAGECEACPDGSYCPIGTSRAIPCARGNYSVGSQYECTMCPAGTSSSTLGATSAAVCEDCSEGE